MHSRITGGTIALLGPNIAVKITSADVKSGGGPKVSAKQTLMARRENRSFKSRSRRGVRKAHPDSIPVPWLA
ncbi:MAG: hypothetical protein Q7J73_10615 [Dehalococcoidales bacterium]|nr:hypothetical protein [Dehalococcoidales bacterium]